MKSFELTTIGILLYYDCPLLWIGSSGGILYFCWQMECDNKKEVIFLSQIKDEKSMLDLKEDKISVYDALVSSENMFVLTQYYMDDFDLLRVDANSIPDEEYMPAKNLTLNFKEIK